MPTFFVHPSNTFIAPVYSLADTGQSSFVWHLQRQYGIQRTLHFYQLAVLYARADTSTDADVLPQPSPYSHGVHLQNVGNVGNAKFDRNWSGVSSVQVQGPALQLNPWLQSGCVFFPQLL